MLRRRWVVVAGAVALSVAFASALEVRGAGHVEAATLQDECGPAGWLGRAVPDSFRVFLVYDFSAACRRHDQCYETLGRTKGQCDAEFARTLERACRGSHRPGTAGLRRCRQAAGAYVRAVHRFGGRHYQRAQAEARARQARAQRAGAYAGTVTWSSVRVTIDPPTQPIAFSVSGERISGDLQGSVAADGNGTITSIDARFWGTTAFTGTIRFTTRAGGAVDVTGRIVGVVASRLGALPVEGRIAASRGGGTPPAPTPAPAPVPTPPLSFTAPSRLPDGTVGEPYSYTFRAIGGRPPYGYTSDFASIFGGIRLSPSGVLSGTPTLAGTQTFRVCVRDSAGAGPLCLSPTLTIQPRGGPFDGSYRGTITYSSPTATITPNFENIRFTVTEGRIAGNLIGSVDSSGFARVTTNTYFAPRFFSGTARFSGSGSFVTVTGTVSGGLTTSTGTHYVTGRIDARRTSP